MDQPGVTPLIEVGKKSLRIGNAYIREAIGEFFGTLIVGFMCVGAGGQFTVNAQVGKVESQIVPVLGIILGIMTAILITGGVSGGHVNPAVSISLAVAGELSWYSVPGYVISQFLGATVGALMGWGLIYPSIRQAFGIPKAMSIPAFDMANNTIDIASVFSPLKSPGCTVFHGLSTELVLTCFLIMAICGAVDKQSAIKPPGYLIPIMIPAVIAAFCFTHEMPTGTLLNPARDVGPRIAAWILGWTPEHVFMSRDYEGNKQHWWVVGLFGPILGGILGAFIYAFIIGPQVDIDHLEEANLQQEREAIRQVLAANSDTSMGWRSTGTTAVAPKPLAVPVSNANPYSTYSNNNEIIADAYQQARYPSSYFPKQSFPQGYPNSGISKGPADSY